jgi:glutamate dehydrogenase (NAD(P)+)
MHVRHTETAVVTGKPTFLGGSMGRREATGHGLTVVTKRALEKFGVATKDTAIVVQGFGNVGSVAALQLQQLGCKIIGISDLSGAYYNKSGIDVQKALDYSQSHGNLLEGFKDAELIANDELLELECDVLIPAALEDVITSKNAHKIKAKIISEGANGPTTAKADPILVERGIYVIPDILANAGGVTVSYFEWVQDRIGYYWSEEDVNQRLDRIMTESFDSVNQIAEKYDVSLRISAYILAIDRVAKTLKLRGIYA